MKLTPKHAAERAGVSLALIYQWCEERRLPHFRCGGLGKRGRILIDESDLAEFLKSCRVDSVTGIDDDLLLKHARKKVSASL